MKQISILYKIGAKSQMNTYIEELNKLLSYDFFQLAKKEDNIKKRIRLLALGHLRAGKSKAEVIEMFQISFPTLRHWLVRFLKEGPEGLSDKAGRGRKRKLHKKFEEEFKKELEMLRKKNFTSKIRVEEVQRMLKEKFFIDHALPTIYHLLERTGFPLKGKSLKNKRDLIKIIPKYTD
jgi:transposase